MPHDRGHGGHHHGGTAGHSHAPADLGRAFAIGVAGTSAPLRRWPEALSPGGAGETLEDHTLYALEDFSRLSFHPCSTVFPACSTKTEGP